MTRRQSGASDDIQGNKMSEEPTQEGEGGIRIKRLRFSTKIMIIVKPSPVIFLFRDSKVLSQFEFSINGYQPIQDKQPYPAGPVLKRKQLMLRGL